MYKASATELRKQLIEKQISAKDIATYYLRRCKAMDKDLGSFIEVLEDRILQKARLVDQKIEKGEPVGLLAGVPVAIKDNIHVQGVKTTCASKIMRNYQALFDSTVVELLEKEDALIIGKTNLDEFAMGSSTEHSAFFETKNPWDLGCSPGGSSGGSAACVAARLSPLSLGSDTGGSIRQPAAFCGIVGFKPTYGRVSRYGLVAFGSSLDQIGPFSQTVEDAALAMEVLGRGCSKDSTSIHETPEPYTKHLEESISGKRIGVPWHFLSSLQGEELKLFQKTLEVYKSLGTEIVDIHLDDLKYSIPTYYVIAPAEASTNLARYDGIGFSTRTKEAKNLEEVYLKSRQEGFGSEVKQRILLGTYVLSSGFKEAYYKKALKVRELIVSEYKKAFETCDIVAMPTTPKPAFELGSIADSLEMYAQDLYSISANLAGLPAISVPCGFINGSKPFGMQLIGPKLEDARVLRFGHQLEKSLNMNHIPPLFDKEVSS